MGLDMYLTKRTFVRRHYFQSPERQYQVTVTRGGAPTHIKPDRVRTVEEEVAYWRKANQIHRWFVEHVQGGDDDCRPYDVSRGQLQSLLDTVQAVLAKPETADQQLPTREGFFFGSTEYDGYYFDDLKGTERMLAEILNEPEDDGWLVYQSSW